MPTLIVYGLLAIGVLGSIGALYGVVRHGGVVEGRAEVRSDWDAAIAKRRAWETKKNADATNGLKDDRAKARTIIQERTVYVDKIVDRPVYSNQCLDAAGMQCVNATIRGESAARCKPD